MYGGWEGAFYNGDYNISNKKTELRKSLFLLQPKTGKVENSTVTVLQIMSARIIEEEIIMNKLQKVSCEANAQH